MTISHSNAERLFPPPSRHSNPFATCWTKPGALAFKFSNGESAEQVVGRLAAQNWRGEIIGPHGAGKSTLLETLKPWLAATGRQVTAITLREREHRLPRGFLQGALAPPQPLVIIDGYERLSRPNRVWLRWQCRRFGAGLLVTSHVAADLPPLIRLQPELDLIEQLVSQLNQFRPSTITPADIAASHACRGSNVRELLFDLYDRHEAVCRATRTANALIP
jgi:hypothetical protein